MITILFLKECHAVHFVHLWLHLMLSNIHETDCVISAMIIGQTFSVFMLIRPKKKGLVLSFPRKS